MSVEVDQESGRSDLNRKSSSRFKSFLPSGKGSLSTSIAVRNVRLRMETGRAITKQT